MNLALALLVTLACQEEPAPAKPAPPPPVVRSPVPDAADRARLSEELKQLFEEEFSKRDAESLKALAQKFLANAAGTAQPAPRFVMLVEARDLAVQAGDIDTAFLAIDRIEKDYDLGAADPEWSPTRQRLDVLSRVRRKMRTPSQAASVASAYLTLAREALEAGNFDIASDAAKEAGSAARTARDSLMSGDAKALASEINEVEKEFKGIKTAELTLSVDPNDPDANLLVGRFLCFVRGDWDQGLPCLARSGDPGLMGAAQLELAKPDTADGQAGIGDAWFEISKNERRKRNKEQYLERAREWYGIALQRAEGLVKIALEKKLASLPRQRTTGRDVTRGLIARWGFDDPRRPGFESGRRCHGKPSAGGAAWARDPARGGVMSFDGSGAHLVLPDNPQSGHSAGTWTFWLKVSTPSAEAGYGGQVYVQESSVWIAQSHGGIGIDLNSGAGWFDTQGGAAQGAIAGKGKISANTWHHIAFSWDGKTVRCFHNGVMTAEAPTVGPKVTYPVSRLGPGTTRAMGSRVSSASYNLKGMIDEFRIYGRALSDMEVALVYRATHSGRTR